MRTEKFKLKDISTVAAGNSAPAKDEFSTEGIPFIRAGSLAFLTNGESIEKCEKIDKGTASTNRLKLFPKHSILFAKSGMSAMMGRVYELPVDAYIVSHLAVIQPNPKYVNPSFLKYFLYHKPPFYLIRDQAYPSIKLSDIEEIDVDLPDIETQNKIVALLDKANSLLNKREQTIRILDEFLKANFLDMFGDPSSNQFNFPKGQIRDIVEEVKYGTSSPAEDNGNYPYLRMNNITYEGYWDFSSLKHINIKENDKEKYIVRKGDLLFNRTNSKELVGKTAVFTEDKEMAIAGYLIRVRTNEFANPWYLWGYLNSYHGKRTLSGMCKSIVGMANINAQEFQNIEILLPEISLQNKYAKIVEEVVNKKKKMEFFLSEFRKFNTGLLHRSFNNQVSLDIDFELEALLGKIDLQKKENDLSKIAGDIAYLQRLVDKLNAQEFTEKALYDKAKHVAFQLMTVKEEKRRVTQEYNEKTESIELALK